MCFYFGLIMNLNILLQSHQARIATLYLPIFGLLIENVHRIDVKDISPFPINASSSVSIFFKKIKPSYIPECKYLLNIKINHIKGWKNVLHFFNRVQRMNHLIYQLQIHWWHHKNLWMPLTAAFRKICLVLYQALVTIYGIQKLLNIAFSDLQHICL